MKYTNFYETVPESNIRLRNTVILYEGEPYYVLGVTDHKGDGVFRIYLEPLPDRHNNLSGSNISGPLQLYPSDHSAMGDALDEWIEGPAKKYGILRKKMNSPAFNKFRPFPLGMCNFNGNTLYLERSPTRRTEQGLVPQMVMTEPLPTFGKTRPTGFDLYSAAVRDCITGRHPSLPDCLTALADPEVLNDSAAFHRHFAVSRGPLDLVFLVHKTDVVGILTNGDASRVRLGRAFRHLVETVQTLGVFGAVA